MKVLKVMQLHKDRGHTGSRIKIPLLIGATFLIIVSAIVLYFNWEEQSIIVRTELVTIAVAPDGLPPGGIGLSHGGMIFVNSVGGNISSVSVPLEWGYHIIRIPTGTLGHKAESSFNLSAIIPEFGFWLVELERSYSFDQLRTEQFLFGRLFRTAYSNRYALSDINARAVSAPDIEYLMSD